MKDSSGTSRKTETYGDAGVCPAAFGKFSETIAHGTTTMTCPMILRHPVSPRLRWRCTFM